MPNLNYKGPENKGPKTGRKTGECHKTEEEKSVKGEPGIGEGKRHHSGEGQGKGIRLNTFKQK